MIRKSKERKAGSGHSPARQLTEMLPALMKECWRRGHTELSAAPLSLPQFWTMEYVHKHDGCALHVLHAEPSLKVFFSDAIHGGRHLPAQAVKALSWRDQLVGGIIRDGIRSGSFRECDADFATWMVFGTLVPFVIYRPLFRPERHCDPYPETEVEKIVATGLKLFMAGLKSDGANDGKRPG